MGAWGIRVSKGITPSAEVLRNPINLDVTASVVIDATTVAPDINGNRVLFAGTALTKDAVTNQYHRYTGAAGETVRGILVEDQLFPDGTAASDAVTAIWCHGQWFRTDKIIDWATQDPGQAAGVTIGDTIRAALPTCRFD